VSIFERIRRRVKKRLGITSPSEVQNEAWFGRKGKHPIEKVVKTEETGGGLRFEIRTDGPVREVLEEQFRRQFADEFAEGLKNPAWKTDEEEEVQKKVFYVCDASKNTACPKTHCHLFGGPCRATSDLNCAYVEYGERPDEHFKMVYKFISKDEEKKIPFPEASGRTGKKRCEYCGCVSDRDYGTCEHCGAPL